MLIQTHLQKNFDDFIKYYPSTKLIRNENELLYVFKTFYNAAKATQEANKLIFDKQLDLVAIHYGANSHFVVRSSETSDI